MADLRLLFTLTCLKSGLPCEIARPLLWSKMWGIRKWYSSVLKLAWWIFATNSHEFNLRIRGEWYSPLTQMIGLTFPMDSPRIHRSILATPVCLAIGSRHREFAKGKCGNDFTDCRYLWLKLWPICRSQWSLSQCNKQSSLWLKENWHTAVILTQLNAQPAWFRCRHQVWKIAVTDQSWHCTLWLC